MILWFITLIALTGTLLNAKKNKYGFVLWMISNLYLCLYNLMIAEFPLSVLFGIYWLLAIYGYYKWDEK